MNLIISGKSLVIEKEMKIKIIIIWMRNSTQPILEQYKVRKPSIKCLNGCSGQKRKNKSKS